MQVLLHWDDAEVCKMCNFAQVARDRLQLMGASNSMRSLVLCFRVSQTGREGKGRGGRGREGGKIDRLLLYDIELCRVYEGVIAHGR